MIKITCSSCQKPLSLDETKLPMKEVAFPCPVCKTKISVDRRKLGGEAAAAPQSAAPQPEAAFSSSEPDNGGDDDNNDDEFGTKAFIVGADNPTLRQAVKLVGYLPIFFATAEQARDRYLQEPPPVVIINPQPMTAPPLEAMQPLVGLGTADRRKSFFILVSDNLRTLDGNAAFLYGVNLTVATKDLSNFSRIFKEAFTFHERLYSSMNAVLRSLETGV